MEKKFAIKYFEIDRWHFSAGLWLALTFTWAAFLIFGYGYRHLLASNLTRAGGSLPMQVRKNVLENKPKAGRMSLKMVRWRECPMEPLSHRNVIIF
jgi:hypothetical protein